MNEIDRTRGVARAAGLLVVAWPSVAARPGAEAR